MVFNDKMPDTLKQLHLAYYSILLHN